MTNDEQKRVEEIRELTEVYCLRNAAQALRELSFLLDIVKRQEEEIGRLPCNGCKWSGMIRPQKCATCCRNKHMKDNYQEATP